MNQNLVDDFYALTSLISPTQVSRYLHAQGWDLIDRREGLLEEWAEPTVPNGDFDSEIHLLPVDQGYRDFTRRFVEFLTAVAGYYEIDARELSHRIRLGNADVLLFRISRLEDKTDSIGLDEASGVLRVAQRMLKMSARYTASPGKEFTGRMRPEAREYIRKHVSLGHTRRGSFVIPILSGPQTGRGEEALFSRRVMENLAVGLQRVQELTGEVNPVVSGEFAPLVVALAHSLHQLSRVPEFQVVDISFRWAPELGAPRRVPDRAITLERSLIRRIGAVRIHGGLQGRSDDRFTLMASPRSVEGPAASPAPALPPVEYSEIIGQIVALQIDDRRIRDWGTRYSIVIRSESRDGVLDVQIPVSESDYQRAAEARVRGVTATAAGILSSSETGYIIEGEVIFNSERSR